ncbi:MAG: hypothetical protein ACOZIN_13115 [Myxococcota bacterium]
MRQVRAVVLGAALLAVVGCGRGGDDSFAEATPDFDGLSLEISGAASEGAALSGTTQQGLGENAPEYLKNAREAVANLNAHVKKAIEPIAELVAANVGKTQPGDSKVYGPKDRGNATYRFTIKRQTQVRFGWLLQAKPLGADDSAYKAIAAGALTKGELPHRGRGVIGIDLDNLKAVDSATKGQGKLLCGFAHVGDTKTLVYGLKGFTPDASVHEPVNAAFVGHRLMPSRATRVRMASFSNVVKTTDAKELVRSRVRYIPGIGGRADVLATGGDVPAGKVYVGSACWDAQENEGFAVLRVCDRGQPLTCQVVETRGQLSNCQREVEREELPPENAEDLSLEPEAPAGDIAPPGEMPSGSGE